MSAKTWSGDGSRRADRAGPTYAVETESLTDPAEAQSHDRSNALRIAQNELEHIRRRLLQAAIQFADGECSSGQLIATRKLLLEQENLVDSLSHESVAPQAGGSLEPDAVFDALAPETVAPVESRTPAPFTSPTDAPEPVQPMEPLPTEALENLSDDVRRVLLKIREKMVQTESDHKTGNLNRAQYVAIMRHYNDQIAVTRRLLEVDPASQKWRTIVAEGKTSFLQMQLAATALAFAIFRNETHKALLEIGSVPADEAHAALLLQSSIRLAGRKPVPEIMGTVSTDGKPITMINGEYTSAVILFSQAPPVWQLNAFREVHRTFEVSNRHMLARADLAPARLVFPDLSRLIKVS